jgi:flagella basal body P-ring formation protein FlgA
MLIAGLSCLQAIAALPAGAVPVRSDFAVAPCEDVREGVRETALRFDSRIGALRATRDIAAGEIVPAGAAAMLPDVRPGDPLYLVARVGTATVERQVAAAQPGRHGRYIFVRTSDGRLVRARIAEDGQ